MTRRCNAKVEPGDDQSFTFRHTATSFNDFTRCSGRTIFGSLILEAVVDSGGEHLRRKCLILNGVDANIPTKSVLLHDDRWCSHPQPCQHVDIQFAYLRADPNTR